VSCRSRRRPSRPGHAARSSRGRAQGARRAARPVGSSPPRHRQRLGRCGLVRRSPGHRNRAAGREAGRWSPLAGTACRRTRPGRRRATASRLRLARMPLLDHARSAVSRCRSAPGGCGALRSAGPADERVLPIHQAKRQSTGRSHRAPALKLASDERFQLGESISGATIGNLKIKMDSRAVVPDLLVDVGVALGRGEAAEFREARPRLAERPAQRRRPKGRRLLGHIGGHVDEDMQPLSSLGHGT
jgi:hypothetical protein